MKTKIIKDLTIGYLVIIVIMTLITYFLIYPLAVDKGTAIATMFGWSAGIFAPLSAFVLLNAWKEQNNFIVKRDLMIDALEYLDEAFRAIGQIYWLIYINETKSYFYPYNEKNIPVDLYKFIMDEHTIFVKTLGKFHKVALRVLEEEKSKEFNDLYKILNKLHDEIIYVLDMKNKKIQVDIRAYNEKFPYLYDYYHELLKKKENYEQLAKDYLIAK
ncbi:MULTISPECIES: hypothetical protein [Acinetobacter]|jgi:hypothetical protein|uniref:Uncharacterized protein n=3 Tax=Gammaproteobacteria TaxID=1236 RepID=N8WQE6_9GAMM|nr:MULTISPECIES: hypothetical protein [Acinetobacter]AWD71110.1 hypothetical protein C0119_13300 [Acinetobacter schindleri]EIM39195.1 hypothetical protein HADU_08626 [Acinetobacter sp. HA]ENV14327.1 hypothetical protein F965_00571 [Acinetobacter schindleri NIPH 900]RAZ04527.1 hypothetical protein C8322_05305 [Acinetobacter sp. SM1B]